MNISEHQRITALSDRIRAAQPVEKDEHAADLIQQVIGTQPDALYILVQAVLIQEDALQAAQVKISQLSEQHTHLAPPPRTGGLLTSLFGQSKQSGLPESAAAGAAGAPASPNAPQSARGGFLTTAAAAVAGVAGGQLLFQGISNIFSAENAHADGMSGHTQETVHDDADWADGDGPGW